MRINLISGFLFDMISGWDNFFRLSLDERKRKLADSAGRRQLRECAASDDSYLGRQIADFANMQVAETFAPETGRYTECTLGEAATDLGKDPFDLFCDIALADDDLVQFGEDAVPALAESIREGDAVGSVECDRLGGHALPC